MASIIGTILQNTAVRVLDRLRPLAVRPFVGYEEYTEPHEKFLQNRMGGTNNCVEKTFPLGVPVRLSNKLADDVRQQKENVVQMTHDKEQLIGNNYQFASDTMAVQLLQPKGTRFGNMQLQVSVGLDDDLADQWFGEPEYTKLTDQNFRVGENYASYLKFNGENLALELIGFGKTLDNLQSVTFTSTTVIPHTSILTKVGALYPADDIVDTGNDEYEDAFKVARDDADVLESMELFATIGVHTHTLLTGNTGTLRDVLDSALAGGILADDFYLTFIGEFGDGCSGESYATFLDNALSVNSYITLDLGGGDEIIIESFISNVQIIEQISDFWNDEKFFVQTFEDFEEVDCISNKWFGSINISDVIELVSGFDPDTTPLNCDATLLRDTVVYKEGTAALKVSANTFRENDLITIARKIGEDERDLIVLQENVIITAWIKNPSSVIRSLDHNFEEIIFQNKKIQSFENTSPQLVMHFNEGSEFTDLRQLVIDGVFLEQDDNGWSLYGFPISECYSPNMQMSEYLSSMLDSDIKDYLYAMQFIFKSGACSSNVDIWIDKIRFWFGGEFAGLLHTSLYEYTGDDFPEKGESLPDGPLTEGSPWTLVTAHDAGDDQICDAGYFENSFKAKIVSKSLGKTNLKFSTVWGAMPNQFRTTVDYIGEGDTIDMDKIYALVIGGEIFPGFKMNILGFEKSSGADENSRALVSADFGETLAEIGESLAGTAICDIDYEVFDQPLIIDDFEAWLELMPSGKYAYLFDSEWLYRRMYLTLMSSMSSGDISAAITEITSTVEKTIKYFPEIEALIVDPDGNIVYSNVATFDKNDFFFPVHNRTRRVNTEGQQRAGVPIHCPAGSLLYLRVRSVGSEFKRLALYDWNCKMNLRFDNRYPQE